MIGDEASADIIREAMGDKDEVRFIDFLNQLDLPKTVSKNYHQRLRDELSSKEWFNKTWQVTKRYKRDSFMISRRR
jgi:hypothetical protein